MDEHQRQELDREKLERQKLWEAAEAVRPGGEDLADPVFGELRRRLDTDAELAAAFERLQRLDARIGEAFRAVAARPGLAERILASISQEAQRAAGGTAEGPSPAAKVDRRRVTRRVRWLWAAAAGTLLAAASIIVAIVVVPNSRPPMDQGAFEAVVLEQFDRDAAFFGRGILLTDTPPPARYPPSPDVRLPRARWRWVRSFMGRQGVAYDVALPGGGRATLYVVRTSVTGLPPTPPLVPFNSGGRCVAAWRSGALVYALVLDGSPRIYRQLVVAPRPIT